MTLYSDFRKSFNTNPFTDDILVNEDTQAVKDSIINLIFTKKYERYRQPRLGSGIYHHLFENFSPQTEYKIRKTIEETIDNYEPRAIIHEVVVVPDFNNNWYTVSIIFSTKNDLELTTITQILTRNR